MIALLEQAEVTEPRPTVDTVLVNPRRMPSEREASPRGDHLIQRRHEPIRSDRLRTARDRAAAAQQAARHIARR